MGLTLIENTHVVVVQSITDADTITVIEEPKQVVVNASPDIVTVETLAGVQGEQGPPNTLTVGTVQSGPAPDVTITGTSPNQVVNFTMEKGDTATVAVGTVTTGAPGSNANIINSGTANDAVLDFAIPRGDKGDKGDKGDAATIAVGTTSTGTPGTPASVTNSGTAGDAVFDFVVPEGLKGDKGDAATIAVGTVTTGVAGSSVIITNSGDSGDAVFDFTVPRGDKGETGNTGPVGPPNVLSVGTVTSVPNGTAPTVTITGTSPAQTINFSLEQGPRGDNVEWHSATGAPTSGIGGIGDYYLNRTNGDVYEKTDATTWVFRTNIVGPAGAGSIDTVNGYAGPDVTLTFTDVGAEPSGAVSSHEADTTNIHGISNTANLVYTNDTRLSDARTPTAHTHTKAQITDFAHGHIIGDVTGLQAALDSKEGVIAAGTTSQYYRGDKTWQTLNKAAVGLANVDNTSDANKPISTATQTALDGKANTSHTHTKSQITDFAHTHLIADLPVAASGTSSATLLVRADDSRLSDARTPTAHVHAQADITGLSTALAGKEGTIAAGTTAQYWRGDKTWQTLNAAAVADAVSTNGAQTITGQKTFTGTNFLDGDTRILMRSDSWMGASGSAPTDARYFPNFPGLFSPADKNRWRVAEKYEYFDGTNWVDWIGPSTTALTDGRPESSVAAAADRLNWRVTFPAEPWSSVAVMTMTLPYNFPTSGSTVKVEWTKDNFATLISDTGAMPIAGPYTSWYGVGSQNDANKVRITFNFASTSSIEAIGLWTSRPNAQGSTGEVSNVPYSWASDRSMRLWGVGPASTGAYDLGYSTLRWRTLYTESIDLSNALAQSKTHASADTDSAPTAIHHTLGTGANQAAAGNHTHDLSTTAVNGILPVTKGGTGNAFGPMPPGAVITAASGTTFGVTAAGTSGQVLTSSGASNPVWTTLTKSSVGLSNVDNTSDLNKPISTATQTALDGKAATSHTHAITDVTNLQSSLDAKAAAVHSHSASDITSGIISQDRLTVNIVRVVHNGTDYPARPTGATYVEWVGPTEPTAAVANDTWVSTA